MTELTRQMPNPTKNEEGNWDGQIVFTPKEMNTRARFSLHYKSPVIPVIVVPGIMGTNLRAKRNPKSDEERNRELDPGGLAWRPPPSDGRAFHEAKVWKSRSPAKRQKILDGSTLEVDDAGDISFNTDDAKMYGITKDECRARGWGEVHADSYGGLLYSLEKNLNRTFDFDAIWKKRSIRQHWLNVMEYDHTKWGVRNIEQLTEAELEKHARYHYPVYAVGYNWLLSNRESGKLLEQRILEIIKYWTDRRGKCGKVILVTHSMGGLVARACAKSIPDKIAGVIHGVMPALGAPACYRRIACGTETGSPSFAPASRVADRIAAGIVADIAGTTSEETTAVMATAPGPLQLLPNHHYPRPWVHFGVSETVNNQPGKPLWILSLPSSEETKPYNFYREWDAWYRVINPALADPAEKYKTKLGGVQGAIWSAIDEAESFHVDLLDEHYHANTYAFYGADPEQLSFGSIRWLTKQPSHNAKVILTPANIKDAKYQGQSDQGERGVWIEDASVIFEPQEQDAAGDGTVPRASGIGPAGKVKQLFETRGYDHQGAYHGEAMRMLTHYLIVKIVQGECHD
jgi:pimeloyl-ACP methyl ester carboxylesterase